MGAKILAILKSEQIMATLSGVAIVMVNRKFNLGLTVADMGIICGMLGSLVLGESHKDAMTARATTVIGEAQALGSGAPKA